MILGRSPRIALASALALAPIESAAPQGSVLPAQYRNAVASIDDCAAFKGALETLPNANRFMRAVARTNAAAKSEFETEAQYRDRIISDISPISGDPAKTYVSSEINKYWTSYAAGSGMEALNFHAVPGLRARSKIKLSGISGLA